MSQHHAEIAIETKVVAGGPIPCSDCGREVYVVLHVFNDNITKLTLDELAELDWGNEEFYLRTICIDCGRKQGFERQLWARRVS